MKPSEALTIAWEAILKNKVRSFLTMLGNHHRGVSGHYHGCYQRWY
jgi:hypothetical protein